MSIHIRRLGVAAGMIAALASAVFSRTEIPKKFEFGLNFGLSFLRANSASLFNDEWSQELLSKVIDQTTITPEAGAALSCQGFASYFLGERLGIQAGLGIYSKSVPNTSAFSLRYTWKNGITGGQTQDWAGTGSATSIPLSLNAIYKWRKDKIDLFVSGGPTLFFNSFESATTSGFGVSDVVKIQVFIPPNWVESTLQNLDALPVGLSIEKQSWMALGFDIGGGIDYKLNDKWALTADIRWFFCPAKDMSWTWTSGTYDGILGILKDWQFSADLAHYAENRTTPMTVRTSVLRLAIGAKLFL